MVTRKDLFIAHHTGSAGNWPTLYEECCAMWFWQAYHQSIGGADIYYGIVVFPSGRAYEGRYGGLLANNGGAYGCCGRGLGVALPGNFTHELPTIEALDTLVHIGLDAKEELHIPPDNYIGHRDCCEYHTKNCGNECPGNLFYNWIPVLRSVVDIEEKGEEDEDMPKIKLDRRGGDFGADGYVHAIDAKLEHDDVVEFFADVNDDYSIVIYAHPMYVEGYISTGDFKAGGYSGKVKGGEFNVCDITKNFSGKAWITVHSPHLLHGGVIR